MSDPHDETSSNTPPEEGDANGSKPRTSGYQRSHDPQQSAIDADLMARVAAADESAIEELYERFATLVYRMAIQALPTRAEAEDAVQDIFVRLWKTAARYDARKAALVTWVMLITRRHIVDCLRRTRARIQTVYGDDDQSPNSSMTRRPSDDSESRDEFARLLKRVESLPELQRIVVTRAYLGGQTLRQIGEQLDTPIGTIKSALSRALVRLRERSEEDLR